MTVAKADIGLPQVCAPLSIAPVAIQHPVNFRFK